MELRNKADAFIAQLDVMLEDEKDKLGEQGVETLKARRDALQQALDQNDMAKVETELAALEKAAQEASQAMYQQASQAQDQGTTTNSNNDDVVDAEFTEKK